MTKKLVYIAMYRALDCLFDETQREDLGNYLSEANPYLFTDRKSADPAVYAGFSNYYDNCFTDDDITSEKSYTFVRKYLLSEHLSYYGDFAPLFDDISLEEWTELCSIIEGEETKQALTFSAFRFPAPAVL